MVCSLYNGLIKEWVNKILKSDRICMKLLSCQNNIKSFCFPKKVSQSKTDLKQFWSFDWYHFHNVRLFGHQYVFVLVA